MPIETQFCFESLNEERFKEIDYALMGKAYEVQNEYGRLFDESHYQHELFGTLKGELDCVVEEPVTVSYKTFVKTFRMDLVVGQGLICELKVTRETVAAHEAQLLQYMLLCEASRGKVINFGASSVEGKLISTELNHVRRRDLNFDSKNWRELNSASVRFKNEFVDLLRDIGGFLTLELYYEAITHLLGGPSQVIGLVEVLCAADRTSTQRCHLLDKTTAFKISAMTGGIDGFRKQLQTFLNHTSLTCIQWVNLNHQNVAFETIAKY